MDLGEVRAICFDLDDTLCAYWAACREGLRRTFLKHPVPGWTPEDMLLQWAAAYREVCPKVAEGRAYEDYLRSGDPSRRRTMWAMLRRMEAWDPALGDRMARSYRTERLAALALFPGARKTLDALRGRYRLGLITNGPADVQRDEVEKLGLAGLFDPLLIEGEMGFGKPDPRVFALAAERLGLVPSQVLMVGNSRSHDILPAIRAGWRTVWVQGDGERPPSTEGLPAEPHVWPAGGPVPDATVGGVGELLRVLPQ